MLSNLKNSLRSNLINYKGWTTNRKIIVFESDDWGAIRLPDIAHIDKYRKLFPKTNNPYLKYDSLASEDDLNKLFSLITECKDNYGNHPKFTFNTVVANPDFERIKNNNYDKYYFEPFTDTLKKYSNHSQSFDLWKKAMDENLMHPQFHGREHVNVPLWLHELKKGNRDMLNAFELGTWSIPENKSQKINLQASLDWINDRPINYQENYLEEGLSLFEEIFGFKSITMIPNNFILGEQLHEILKNKGIKVIQGMKYQILPFGEGTNKKRRIITRFIGSENEHQIKYFVRNGQYEPTQNPSNYDNVNECMREISNAFFWNKPAIINTHRLNYVGVYDQKAKDENLKKFKILIKSILKKWPNVEFMDSEELTNALLER
ncbi:MULTISPECIES: hypothetical protein [unclassified Flavobacterium]|uniref:hypothetical protein n=1 Tax=unclassified Flavobacterium TaxID=196869 RepID=UPI0012919505|nr:MULTISPECIES: hypothetical protein [unclassified Flavobacterium]MQP52062.1 hypothetical protein [Flavobacterium sp. LMO9]MQP61931.1 hypothetical protein [Flavobacterium sp. LMO6]